MKYQGGKGRIARRIVDTIADRTRDAHRWVEPFVGGAWVLEEAAAHPRFTDLRAGDALPDLVMLYQAVADGWDPPTAISRELYDELKTAEPSPLRAIAGFGSAYGGNWFTGYCGDQVNGTLTHAELSARHLVRRRPVLARTRLACRDYTAWEPDIGPGTVVYCDPPYANTIGYTSKGRAAAPFDTPAFWHWCAAMAARGAHVFVSEYDAPPGIVQVWGRAARQTISAGTNLLVTDRLYHLPPPGAPPPGPDQPALF